MGLDLLLLYLCRNKDENLHIFENAINWQEMHLISRNNMDNHVGILINQFKLSVNRKGLSISWKDQRIALFFAPIELL